MSTEDRAYTLGGLYEQRQITSKGDNDGPGSSEHSGRSSAATPLREFRCDIRHANYAPVG